MTSNIFLIKLLSRSLPLFLLNGNTCYAITICTELEAKVRSSFCHLPSCFFVLLRVTAVFKWKATVECNIVHSRLIMLKRLRTFFLISNEKNLINISFSTLKMYGTYILNQNFYLNRILVLRGTTKFKKKSLVLKESYQ